MTGGTNDTKTVKTIVGKRIKQARKLNNHKMTQQALADKLSCSEKAPILNGKLNAVSLNRLKKWEDGTNPVELEWIPAICDVLECDVGYLFGEYEELTRQVTDICKETGLSEKAADSLIGLHKVGPGESFSALVSLLENEAAWKFLGHKEEEITGINPITAIGNYLSGGNPANGLILQNGERICGENYQILQSLILRMYLDKVQEALKELKKNFYDSVGDTVQNREAKQDEQ